MSGLHFRSVPQNLLESQTNFTTSFIQEVVANPFLYNGYAVNLGVYTIIASMKPLRIYVLNGEPACMLHEQIKRCG